MYTAVRNTGIKKYDPVSQAAGYNPSYTRPIMALCDIGKININNTRYLKSKQVK
jgi:hypothetical protein